MTISRNESLIELETNEIRGYYYEKAEKLLGETPEIKPFALGKLRELFAGEIFFHKTFQNHIKIFPNSQNLTSKRKLVPNLLTRNSSLECKKRKNKFWIFSCHKSSGHDIIYYQKQIRFFKNEELKHVLSDYENEIDILVKTMTYSNIF